MGNMTLQEAIEIIDTVFKDTQESDDAILSISNDNKNILLNMLILSSRVDSKYGLEPVIKAFEENTNHMNNIASKLVSNNRYRLNDAIARLKEEV